MAKRYDHPGAFDEPAPAATVRFVRPAAAREEPEERGGPLQIEYSATRILPEVRQRLHAIPGVVRADRSKLAEAFKMLRNQVLQRLRAEGHKVLAVTSPRAIPGKSLTALNLSLAMAANYDTAVLLVDADLTRRGLQSLLGLGGEPGLADHLAGSHDIAELLINPALARFVFLPAGREAALDSAELLSTRTAVQLMQTMKQRYQDRYIVVDLPPALDTADAVAFLPQADATLVVVEEHGTSVADLAETAELLAPFNVIGTVMTPRPEPQPAAPRARPWPWPGRNRTYNIYLEIT